MTRSSINLARTSALRRLAPLDLAQQDLGDHALAQQLCADQQQALLHQVRLEAGIAHQAQREEAVQLGQQGIAQQRQGVGGRGERSEEHTSELQSLMRISYAVFCLKHKKE